jgi:hypothetical protein
MAVPSRQTSADTEPTTNERSPPERTISIHSTAPERSVFIEDGNEDGWISTDLTVALER